MRLEEACDEIFARHETFHPRLSWFRKAYHAANREANGVFFLDDLAPVRLGVGKNMVRSIRFWGTAARLITDVPDQHNSRLNNSVATNYGVALLGPQGADPLMEQPATWWWLHWMMLSPVSALPVWWLIFNQLNVVEFTQEFADQFVEQQLDAAPFKSPTASSVSKDVSVLLRTYAERTSGRGKYDDQFGAPLRDLHLIEPSGAGFRFATDPDPTLSGPVVLAALLDFLAVMHRPVRTLSLARAVSETGSPARAFRLSEDQIAELIRPVVDQYDWIEMTAPAGALQIGWNGDTADRANELLYSIYGRQFVPGCEPLAGPSARKPHGEASWSPEFVDASQAVVL